MPLRSQYDVLILGGGAAGILAATRAARRGRRVLLLEKNARPGVKILMSGGTRCNVTNDRDARGIADAFGPSGRFLFPGLGALDPDGVRRYLHDAGCETKVEDDIVTGKVFPVTDRATDVLAALLRRLEESGAEVAGETPGTAVEALAGGGFAVETPRGPVRGERVLVTTGGASYPRCGTTGDGYAIARAHGHSIVEPLPALVPLVVEVPWVRELRGVAVRASVRVAVGGRAVAERLGSVLFAHFGLTGPAPLDASSPLVRAWRRDGQPGGSPSIELDLLPDLDDAAVDAMLREAASRAGGRLVKHGLAPPLVESVAEAIVRGAAGVAADRRLSALSKDERRRIVQAVKGRIPLPVAGERGFAQAEVTSGGVALEEIDPRTLASKKQPGLHFAGEVLDLDGPIGGFNFQAAFSTGWLAGEHV